MEALSLHTEYIDEGEIELQARYDLQTQFSELVDGCMHTTFDLSFDGKDLYGPDGRGLDEVTKNGLEDAKDLAKKNPQMWFGIRRSSFEREERTELIKMAKGDGPNTMVVASDFPAELMNANQDVGGYNVTRKQCMLRVLTRLPSGEVRMHSQSLDGSNRQALEAIYERFGMNPDPGELLGQRINVDLEIEEQANLVGELTGIYDRSLSEQYGGEWYAGRRPADIRNTYDFVCLQEDIIETCIRLQRAGQLNDNIMYNAAATMQKRFESKNVSIVNEDIIKNHSKNSSRLYEELIMNGEQARLAGKTFNACGSTLSGDGFSTQDGFLDTGYGNKETKSDCTYISKECPMCGTKNVRTKETSTHIIGLCGCRVKKSKNI